MMETLEPIVTLPKHTEFIYGNKNSYEEIKGRSGRCAINVAYPRPSL